MIRRFLNWLYRPCKTMCSNPRCQVGCKRAMKGGK
jgi:hypothetical protein